MKRNHTSKRQIITTLGIVALLSGAIVLGIAGRTAPFYFELAMRSSRPGMAQLFYDIGKGFNENDSVRLSAPAGESNRELRFALPAGEYRALRFDPIERGTCSMTIRSARIVDLSGRTLRKFSPSEFSDFHDVSEKRIVDTEITLNLSATDDDPHFTIPLTSPLALRPSMANAWQFVDRTFLLCFMPLALLAIGWLLFAPRRWTANALLLSFLTVFIYLFARSRFLAPISWDEEVFIWYGSLINAGGVPYRDIFEPKPPVIFFANALGLALFGFKDLLFRIVPTTVAVSSILCFFVAMIRRRVVPWLSILLTAQIALWLLGSDFHDTGLNDSETYGFAFAILGFSLGSLAAGSRRSVLPVLSGICFALAVLSKEFFVFSVVPAWLIVARRLEDRKLDGRQLLLSAAGGIAIGIVFLTYLMAHSAFGCYLDLLRFSKTFAANYCIDIGRFPRVTGLSVIIPSWKMLHAELYNFAHLGFVLPLWAAALLLTLRKLKERSRTADLAIAIVALVLGMVGVSVGYCFWKHYFLIGTAGLLLPSVLGAEAVSDYISTRDWRSSLALFIALSGLFLFVAKTPTQIIFAEKLSGYSPPWDSLVTETIEKHSKPGDYILATEGPVIYVAMNRRNPIPVGGPADDILPYMAAANPTLQMESLRAELEKHLPKVCYFAGWFRPHQKKWHELLYDPLLAKYHYIKVDDRLWYLPDSHN